jgi:hypothetical protein
MESDNNIMQRGPNQHDICSFDGNFCSGSDGDTNICTALVQ